jgi:hypothetical protein
LKQSIFRHKAAVKAGDAAKIKHYQAKVDHYTAALASRKNQLFSIDETKINGTPKTVKQKAKP